MGWAVTEAAAGRGSTRWRRLRLHLILLAFLVGAPQCPESWGGHPARLLGPAVLYQAGNVVDPSKDGCRQASFLHLPVSQPCQYHVVYSFFQEGHRGVAGPACADLGEGAVIGDPSHPSSKCLGGLLWHLPGLMQGDGVHGSVQHRDSQLLHVACHQGLVSEGLLAPLVKGQSPQVVSHAGPELVQQVGAPNPCGGLVVSPLTLKEPPVVL